MSTAAEPLHWSERASDWLNPILVKEMRQTLKSRQFIGSFMIMLAASWLITLFGLLLSGPQLETEGGGKLFFSAYYLALTVTICIVVPFGAFRSLLSERDLQTYEVLSITTLRPSQVVWGKLLSAVTQSFMHFSVISPFIAFTYLLKGIDLFTILFLLLVSLCWSTALSMGALTVSTVAKHRQWQVPTTLMIMGGLVSASSQLAWLTTAGLAGQLRFDRLEFWLFCGTMLAYAIAYFVLCFQICVTQLTFDSDNRSTRVRLSVAAIFWMTIGLGWLSYNGSWTGGPIDTGSLQAVTVLMAIQLGVLGLFIVTEPDELSRRVRRSTKRVRWFPTLFAMLFPGGSRGLLFILFHLIALAGLAGAFAWNRVTPPASPVPVVNFVIAVCLYFTIYLSLGAFVSRVGRTLWSEFRPAHARVVMMLGAATGAILPQLFNFFEVRYQVQHQSLFWLSDPFSTLSLIDQNTNAGDSAILMNCLTVVAALAVFLNVRAMWHGIMEVRQAARESRSNPQQPARSSSAVPVAEDQSLALSS